MERPDINKEKYWQYFNIGGHPNEALKFLNHDEYEKDVSKYIDHLEAQLSKEKELREAAEDIIELFNKSTEVTTPRELVKNREKMKKADKKYKSLKK